MARGLDKHRERQDAIAFWGKDLARRAGRTCELCDGTGDLRPFDVDPEEEPGLQTLALICERCRDVLAGTDADPRTLRFLETAIWSELPPVAELARRMLARIDEPWAREALEAAGG